MNVDGKLYGDVDEFYGAVVVENEYCWYLFCDPWFLRKTLWFCECGMRSNENLQWLCGENGQ